MIILIIGLVIFIILFIAEDKKIEASRKRSEEEWKIIQKRNKELGDRISQFPELHKNFKNFFGIDVSIYDYKEWISDTTVNQSESFLGYMFRVKGDNAFTVSKNLLVEKSNSLTTKEMFSITPKGMGVNFSEMKTYFKKAYWEDRSIDIKYD